QQVQCQSGSIINNDGIHQSENYQDDEVDAEGVKTSGFGFLIVHLTASLSQFGA
ncbi:MAG: hypothetical protein ACI9P7_001988, partial [Candidatus Azotimanducaceae bacterium]